ncbi:alpha-1-acid glycoprotein 1 isoform X2 [Notamacropus eugenii]|uniref:alpha-1-acid glycoprotein 1 isoform X2 n=1 Tax=Notamacropus eugenii TaxID=9315 RepID=UPI003B672BA0
MVLYRVLFVLSFAPLLMCQQPECADLNPVFNDTLIDQLSGKWYYIASVFGHIPYQQEAKTIQSSFYYLIPNKTENVFQGKEYNTIGDRCMYQESPVFFNRTSGTIFKNVRTQKASEEQLKAFREVAKCLGFQEEEVLYTDWSKDKCEPLEKEHNQKENKDKDKDVSNAEAFS